MKAKRVAGIVIATTMIVAGIGLLLYPTLTEVTYAWSQKALAASTDTAQALGKDGGSEGRRMPRGAIARLIITKVGLDAYVMDGTDQDSLAKGPGHYEETPLPGEHGNSALAGHRTMHGHPFRRLDELSAGDKIVTFTTKAKAVYKVIAVKRVDPADVGVIARTRDDRLTLTTCNPVGSARQRLVVVARLVR